MWLLFVRQNLLYSRTCLADQDFLEVEEERDYSREEVLHFSWWYHNQYEEDHVVTKIRNWMCNFITILVEWRRCPRWSTEIKKKKKSKSCLLLIPVDVISTSSSVAIFSQSSIFIFPSPFASFRQDFVFYLLSHKWMFNGMKRDEEETRWFLTASSCLLLLLSHAAFVMQGFHLPSSRTRKEWCCNRREG
jgi:hypothetical protein